MPVEDPIKISRLTVRNDSDRVRRLSVTAYAEWVLGSSRSAAAPYIITEIEQESEAIFARSAWSGEFGGRIAFADLRGQQTSFTGDRSEFFGRNGTADRPAALERGVPLSGKIGTGPRSVRRAADYHRVASLAARAEVVFFLGQTENRNQARDLLLRYRTADLDKVFNEVTCRWDEILDTVQSVYARSQHGRAVKSLAPLSNSVLPRVGMRPVLPG